MTLSQVYPALFTMMSTEPNSAINFAMMASGNPLAVRSPAILASFGLSGQAAAMPRFASSSALSSISANNTPAPDAASVWAIARPMPRPAPVTSAALPAKIYSCVLALTISPVLIARVTSAQVLARFDRLSDMGTTASPNSTAMPAASVEMLENRVEEIAAKVHEAWMETKKAQGVTSRPSEWGEEQMVPYDQLSERAKELDRSTVRAVLSAIKAL